MLQFIQFFMGLPGALQTFIDVSAFILVWFAVFVSLSYKEHSD